MPDDDKYNSLLISEIEQLRIDIRDGFKEMRKEIMISNNNFDERISKIKENYLLSSTFWKIVALLTTLITGAYAFTMILLCKHLI